MLNQKSPYLIICLIMMTLLSISCTNTSPNGTVTDSDGNTLRVVMAPNPNIYPLFVMEGKGWTDNIQIITVPNVEKMVEVLKNDQADVAGTFSATGAQLYSNGTLPDIKIWSINVWRAIYLVSSTEITSLEDLRGKTILTSFKNGALDLILKANLQQDGFDPDKDFTILYQPQPQVQQMFLLGKSDAAVLMEPRTTMTQQQAQQSDISAHIMLDLQSNLTNEATSWKDEELPLGSIFVKNRVLQDSKQRKLFEKFAQDYSIACSFVMQNPEEASHLIAEEFEHRFGTKISEKILIQAISQRYIVLEDRQINVAMAEDLNTFFNDIGILSVDNGFFVQSNLE